VVNGRLEVEGPEDVFTEKVDRVILRHRDSLVELLTPAPPGCNGGTDPYWRILGWVSSTSSEELGGRRLIFDIETNAIEFDQITELWCVCVLDLDTGEEWKFGPDQISAALEMLRQADVLIGHNISQYDLPVLIRLIVATFGNRFSPRTRCTMGSS
jgi:hypothetical protein